MDSKHLDSTVDELQRTQTDTRTGVAGEGGGIRLEPEDGSAPEAANFEGTTTDSTTTHNIRFSAPDSSGDIDWKSVSKWWDLVYVPGHCVEIRAMAPGGETASGYFDDRDSFLAAVGRLNGKAQVYSTINAVRIDLMARGPNVLRGDWKACNAGLATERVGRLPATCDADVNAEVLFVVDIDPERPSDTASTEAELEAALVKAGELREWFDTLGVTSGLGMSGNGVYVIIRLPVQSMTEEVAKRRKAILDMLAGRFSTDTVDLDVKVANPSRIMKVLGTKSIKGADAPEYGRPHRVSMLLELPPEACGDLHAVMSPLLEESVPQEPKSGPVASPKVEETVKRAMQYVAKMPEATSGQHGHDALMKVADVAVNGFGLDDADAMAVLRDYSQRCAPPWSDKELRHKLDEARKNKLGRERGHLLKPTDKRARTSPLNGQKGGRPQINVKAVSNEFCADYMQNGILTLDQRQLLFTINDN